MFQAPAAAGSAATPLRGSAGASVEGAEKSATSSDSARGATSSASTLAPASAPAPKLRSCIVCRSRKVRCDKQSPCANCRRAKIPCVFPNADRPPRWARRLERVVNSAAANEARSQAAQDADPGVNQVMERLRSLEGLVKELTGQLEQARAAANSASGAPSESTSPGSSTHDHGTENRRDVSPATSAGNVPKQFGRLVLHDANRSRYVSSGFWSRVDDELKGLKMDTRFLAMDDSESSGDEMSSVKTPSSTQELNRTPSERHAFLFRHNLGPGTADFREFHPLPSQIPFILNVFAENVNHFIQMVHVPTITKMIRGLRTSDMTSLTPANEALLFSIYYAAITSMEADDVMTNFSATKSELNLKYRLGLEHALAKADFLNAPNVVLLQAFVIFLALVRRHDSPRFVWMMTGLVIRMAQALGLHRDGTHFEHLTPYEVEIRRRVWWALCMLDVRASEDQGTDLTITSGSFDTKLPLNINDTDIEPASQAVPTEREGLTDMWFSLILFEVCDLTQQVMALAGKDGAPRLDEQERLLNEISQKFERAYFRHLAESGNIMYWVWVNVARIVIAKMTLIIYFPMLFSSPSEHFTDGVRNKLFVSAIELAEYNHALNSEPACRHLRWAYQTYTHWHAIVYLLIEVSRRPWSPVVERAWVALHSSWLIPAQSSRDKSQRVWIPLRKLMAKARKHRDAELERLHGDDHAADLLDMEDHKMPVPRSPGPFPAGANVVELFRERWRQLVAIPEQQKDNIRTASYPGEGVSVDSTYKIQSKNDSTQAYSASDLSFNVPFQVNGSQADPNLLSTTSSLWGPNSTTTVPSEAALGQTIEQPYNNFPLVPEEWSDGRTMGPGFVPWLWGDADPSADVFANMDTNAPDMNMELDGEMNWYNWVESTKGMEWDAGPSDSGQF